MTAPTAAQVIDKFRRAIEPEIETLDRLVDRTNAALNSYSVPSYFDQKDTVESYTRMRIFRTVEHIVDRQDTNDEEKVEEVSSIVNHMLENTYVRRNDPFRNAVWEFEKRALNQILEIIKTGQ